MDALSYTAIAAILAGAYLWAFGSRLYRRWRRRTGKQKHFVETDIQRVINENVYKGT